MDGPALEQGRAPCTRACRRAAGGSTPAAAAARSARACGAPPSRTSTASANSAAQSTSLAAAPVPGQRARDRARHARAQLHRADRVVDRLLALRARTHPSLFWARGLRLAAVTIPHVNPFSQRMQGKAHGMQGKGACMDTQQTHCTLLCRAGAPGPARPARRGPWPAARSGPGAPPAPRRCPPAPGLPAAPAREQSSHVGLLTYPQR